MTLHPIGWSGQAGLIVGCLLPDLMDKSLRLAGVWPWGRTVGHSALFWGCMCALAFVGVGAHWWGRRAARPEEEGAGRSQVPEAPVTTWLGLVVGLSVGGCLHLVGDLLADIECAVRGSSVAISWWFGWPWMNPDDVIWAIGPHPAGHRMLTGVEVVVAGWSLRRLWHHARGPRNPAVRRADDRAL